MTKIKLTKPATISRSGRTLWIVTLFLVSSVALAACTGVGGKMHHKRTEKESTFRLTKDGQAASAIVIGKDASSAERHAAEELARYVKAISGADLEILSGRSREAHYKNLILIGQPSTNPMIEKLNAAGAIEVTSEKPGLDGFVIKTLDRHHKKVLVLASAQPRGCLYAVYHLLENYAHVGFFPVGGENIPHNANLTLEPIDLAQRPQFPDREYFQGCAYSYSAQFWTAEDWKAEIDWMAKKKLNLLHLTLGAEEPKKVAMESFGVPMPPLTESARRDQVLLKEIFAYARSLGIRVVGPAFNGYVPADFRKKYPDTHYVQVNWQGVDINQLIYPDDPMFAEISTRFLKEYIRLFGTDHFYNIDPFPETDPGKDQAEKDKLKRDFASAVVKGIRNADPQGIWIASGWAFLDEKVWPKHAVKTFLDAIPADMFILNDGWCDQKPLYKQLDYYFGKMWGFGVLHSMGGWTTVHGDLGDLIRRTHEVVADPQAANCKNFYIMPEIVRHNTVYFDLAADLAWQPQSIALSPYLDDYLARRYGTAEAAAMRPAWDELTASVYGPFDYGIYNFVAPPYQKVPTLNLPDSLPRREPFAPHLKKALELALAQKEKLGDNHLYQIDLIDIARQYLAEAYTLRCRELVAAFKASDKAAFEKAGRAMLKCLDLQAGLLSSDPLYCVQTEIDGALQLPKHSREDWAIHAKDNGEVVRQRYTALFGMANYPTLIDYCGKDMYELVRFYYRPRVEVFIGDLRASIDAPGKFTADKLAEQCKDITAKFIATPFQDYKTPPSPYQGKPVAAAEAVLKAMEE